VSLKALFPLSTEAGFAVTAISRTPGVTYNESFDLQCIIKPHYPSWVPVSVTWRFQPAGSTEFHDLVTFTRDGGVQWGDRYAGFRTRTAIEKAESSNNVRLSISRASDTEAGKYQCVAELWRKNYNSSWTRLADRTSNLLEIRVLRPGECRECERGAGGASQGQDRYQCCGGLSNARTALVAVADVSRLCTVQMGLLGSSAVAMLELRYPSSGD